MIKVSSVRWPGTRIILVQVFGLVDIFAGIEPIVKKVFLIIHIIKYVYESFTVFRLSKALFSLFLLFLEN